MEDVRHDSVTMLENQTSDSDSSGESCLAKADVDNLSGLHRGEQPCIATADYTMGGKCMLILERTWKHHHRPFEHDLLVYRW